MGDSRAADKCEKPPGIWPPYQAFYIHSMLFSTRSAVQSAEYIHDLIEAIATKAREGSRHDFDISTALDHVQNIVLRAAAVSRFLWPVRKGHEGRAIHLRSALEVRDDSPLHNRDLRNCVEHLDERLDVYVESGIVGRIIPEWFGWSPDSQGVPMHFFRAYFIDTAKFQILGACFHLQPVLDEIVRVHQMLNHFDANGGVLRSGT